MYFYLALGFMKKKTWFKEAFLLFIASYGLFGGLLTMAVPSFVWTTYAGFIVLQTTVHHVLMIWVAVYLIVGGKINLKRLNFDFLTKAFSIFAASAAIALLINSIVMWSGGPTNPYDAINMFFLNPFVNPAHGIPLFGDWNLHFMLWSLIFIVGYSVLCFGALWAVRGSQLLASKIKKKKHQNSYLSKSDNT